MVITDRTIDLVNVDINSAEYFRILNEQLTLSTCLYSMALILAALGVCALVLYTLQCYRTVRTQWVFKEVYLVLAVAFLILAGLIALNAYCKRHQCITNPNQTVLKALFSS